MLEDHLKRNYFSILLDLFKQIIFLKGPDDNAHGARSVSELV